MASTLKYSGHVLILMLFMLGVLAELALSALQIATSSGLQAKHDEHRLQRQLQAEAIVFALSRLPVPKLSDVATLLWHPADTGTARAAIGCATADRAQSYTQARCITESSTGSTYATALAGKWWWRLQRVADSPAPMAIGTDTTYFKTLQPQIWQLEVMVEHANDGLSDGLLLRFQQQVRP